MVSNYDLYDITYALICMRNDISNISNEQVLLNIERVLNSKATVFRDNQIRRAIANIEGLDREVWRYVYYNNVYVTHRLLSDECVYQVLKEAIVALQALLNVQEYQKAYDLIDSIHCLPNIIADNNFVIPKAYWRTYVKPYRKKWDKHFLISAEKRVRRRKN